MLTIVSLPLLVYWGFGISTMSLVGNLLFTPILVLFLFLSTLLFFATLCLVPHEPITMALNFVTQAWHYALGFGSKNWIIHCINPPLIILVLPIVALVVGIQHPSCKTPLRRLTLMASIILIFFSYCLLMQKHAMQKTSTIMLDKKLYGIVRTDKKIILIDEGYAAQKKSPEKALEYNILPALFKQYGNVHIADYVIKRPMRSSMKIAATLCKQVAVDQVTLPYFDAPEAKSLWYAYFDLKRTLVDQKVKLVRYNKNASRWWRYRLHTRSLKDAPPKRQSYTKPHRGR